MNLIGASEAMQVEQSVLGAVFLDQNVLDDIAFLEPRDFTGRHQKIYHVMRYLDENQKPVDVITVTEEYAKFGQIDDMGGVGYLVELADSCPTASNAVQYAKIVRSKALRRRGINTAKEIENISHEDFNSDEEYFTAIEKLVTELRPSDTGRMKHFSETRDSYFKHLNKRIDFIKTGFNKFDKWSNGLGRGDLLITAGRPSAGKTALMLQRAYGVAQNPNSGVVMIYSQEMEENKIKDRMISFLSGVSYSKIRNKSFSDKESALIDLAYEQYEDLPIYIQDSAGITIEEIRATARQFKRKFGKIDLIAVDYLQIMKIAQEKNETRAQAVGRVTTTAKHIAREIGCCFNMLSQMTREVEKKGKMKPQLSDLKESSSIEQDADIVEFLWVDPDDTSEKGKVVQHFVAKGRDIGINDFRLLFKGWRMHFEDLEE